MTRCTGINCPMQFDSVDPANCKAVGSCQYATPPITIADQIRAMPDEELANLLSLLASCCECPAQKECEDTNDGCEGAILTYLKKEVREDG